MCPIFTDLDGIRGEVDEHEEHGWVSGWIEDTNATHTHNRLFFVGPIHQPNGIARKRPTRSRIPHKRLAIAMDRVPKRKRVQIDRIAKAKDRQTLEFLEWKRSIT